MPTDLAFSPDGATLAAGMSRAGAEIRLWRVGDGTLLRRFKSQKDTEVVNASLEVSFSPDGKSWPRTGSGTPAGALRRRDREGAGLIRFDRCGLADGPLAFSPDGRTLATTGDRQALHFWDLATGKDRLATPEAHQGGVEALAFLADGKTLVSGSDDRTVRVWDLATGRPTKMLPHDGWVRSLSVSADGSLLAAGATYPGGESPPLEPQDRRAASHLVGREDASCPRGVTLDGDGSSVIAALGDGSLRRWDVSTGKERPIAQPKRGEGALH